MSQAPADVPVPVQVDPPAIDSTKKKVSRPRKPKAEASVHSQDTPAADENIITVEVKPKGPEKRSFTVLSVIKDGREGEFKGGKFQSKTPAGAARKAANLACKALNPSDPDEVITVEINIREVTKNGSGKDYSYRATRKPGSKDVDFAGNEGGVKIVFKHEMALKSLKKSATGKVIAEEEVATDEATVEP